MDVKKVGLYLIVIGGAVFMLVFITQILAFLFNNPILGLALVTVMAGVGLLIYGIYREKEQDSSDEPFRGIDQ